MMSSRTYWCYQCQRSVHVAGRVNVLCPFCNEGFVEEMLQPAGFTTEHPFHRRRNNDAELPARNRSSPWNIAIPVHRSGDSSLVDHRMIAPFLDGMGLAVQRIHSGPPRGLYTAENMILLQGRMGNIGGDGGGLEVFVDDGMGLAVRRLPRDFGDYMLGPGIDQLIRQLGENDPHRHEGHPAAQSAVDAMPTIAIGSEHLYEDSAQCAVCKDHYEAGSDVRQMPCNHMYHADCILPWLAHHNSCPVCRFEMPTEQSTNNSTGTASHTSSNSSGGRASGGSGARRIPFNLPWPFRFLNSNASSSADPNPNASSSAGNNHRRQSPRDHQGLN